MWQGVLETPLCDIVCRCLAARVSFPVSSTNKTDLTELWCYIYYDVGDVRKAHMQVVLNTGIMKNIRTFHFHIFTTSILFGWVIRMRTMMGFPQAQITHT